MSNSPSWETLEGGCMCHSIRYEMTLPPIFADCCHCRNCQLRSGSSFALDAQVETSALVVTSETKPASNEVEPNLVVYTCPNCYTKLWANLPATGPGIAYLAAGTLDQSEKISPDAHFFVRSKHPWIQIPEGQKTFETMPTESDTPYISAEGQARLAAATGKTV